FSNRLLSVIFTFLLSLAYSDTFLDLKSLIVPFHLFLPIKILLHHSSFFYLNLSVLVCLYLLHTNLRLLHSGFGRSYLCFPCILIVYLSLCLCVSLIFL